METAPARRSVTIDSPGALVRAHGEKRPAVVEIPGIVRRSAFAVDDPAIGDPFALVHRDHQLSFGDHRRGHVEHDRIGAIDRHADRDRIRRKPAIGAAERRDALRARRVEKVQRHLARLGGHVRPIADPSQVTDVAQADHRNAFLARLGDAELRSELAGDLPEAAIAVDDGDRVAVEDDGGRRVGPQRAILDPFEISRNTKHAVRIVADEIRVDQPARNGRGLLRSAPGAMHDGDDEIDELRGGDGRHGVRTRAPPG